MDGGQGRAREGWTGEALAKACPLGRRDYSMTNALDTAAEAIRNVRGGVSASWVDVARSVLDALKIPHDAEVPGHPHSATWYAAAHRDGREERNARWREAVEKVRAEGMDVWPHSTAPGVWKAALDAALAEVEVETSVSEPYEHSNGFLD